MVNRKGLWIGFLLLLLLLPGPTAAAAGPSLQIDDGQIFVDEDVRLERGETFQGDLGIFDGDLDIPAEAAVSGDVFVVNGDVEIGGLVQGDLAVIDGSLVIADGGLVQGAVFVAGGRQAIAGRVAGDLSSLFGQVELRDTALIQGDLTILSGTLDRQPGARITGEEIAELDLPLVPFSRSTPPERQDVPEITRPEVPARRSSGRGFVNLLGEVLSAGLVSLLLIAAGLFVAFVWPRPTRRVADCIRLMPVQTFGMGLLTFLIAAGLEALAGVLMIVVILVAALLISTVILIPVGLLLILLSVLVLLPVPLALAGAMAFGWVALAEVVGRAIARLLGATQMKPIGAVLVGLLITVPVTAFLWIAKPVCCAWPFIILLTSVGLGAVVHTRFGRQACDQAAGQPPREALPPEAMDDEAGEPDLPPAAGS